MRVLIAHPNNNYNCGDLLTYCGAVNLLSDAIGRQNINIAQFDFIRALAEAEYVNEYDFGDLDAVVLAGTPWLWLGCAATPKYRVVTDLRARFPGIPFIGLGIGSMFQPEISQNIWKAAAWVHDCFRSESDLATLRDFYSSFAVLVTRDSVAYHVLRHLGVEATDSFDTSIYGLPPQSPGTRERAALFFHDPHERNGGRFVGAPPEKIVAAQLEWAAVNHADIFTNCPEDCMLLRERGVPFELSVDLEYLQSRLRGYSRMLSGKVHMAVLGKLAGIGSIEVVPLDSRHLTATRLGATPRWVAEPYESPIETLAFSWEAVATERARLVERLREKLI